MLAFVNISSCIHCFVVFRCVGILDVQQIFGRAGRPAYDTSGHAMMIMEGDKLPKYLALLTHQLPIESQFIKELPNHLNAEIILGTVTNVQEGLEWLGYTYLYTRMLRNPMVYGIGYDKLKYDELLIGHRSDLIIDAAKQLMRCKMVKFDMKSGNFYSTDIGRIASHYYLHYESVELYNELLKPSMTEEDILHLLASSKEFSSLKVRDEETRELETIARKYAPVKIKGGIESETGKANALVQTYISNGILDTSTLISDSYFISQSAGRISRALFEMVLKRGRTQLATQFLSFAKMIERRIWSFQHPLRQFVNLKPDLIRRLEERKLSVERILDMEPGEIGAIIHQNTMGATIKHYASQIPYLQLEASCQPITRSVLKITLVLTPEFQWHDRVHGSVEPFHIWIEDSEHEHIYHTEYFLLHKKQSTETHKLVFTIPIIEPLPPQYFIKAVSDRWLGSENTIALSFKHLLLPQIHAAHTALLPLHPLPRSVLFNPAAESMYTFTHFNPIQTQAFHTLYHTDENILLGAPTGSGKTIVAELCMLRLFGVYPGRKVVYIAPLKALARERVQDWTRDNSFKGKMGKKVIELTGDTAPDMMAIKQADILITTPEVVHSLYYFYFYTARALMTMLILLYIHMYMCICVH